MSDPEADDLVKRLRTPWDADRSIISQTDNWMRERQEAADRIKELEAENKTLRSMVEGMINDTGDDPEIMAASRAEWAARAREAEAKLAELEPKDGRPCATDEFLAVILDELDDNWDIFEAIKDWVEGDWVNAVQGTTLAELKGEK